MNQALVPASMPSRKLVSEFEQAAVAAAIDKTPLRRQEKRKRLIAARRALIDHLARLEAAKRGN